MSEGDDVDWFARSLLKSGTYYDAVWWRFEREGSTPEILIQPHTRFDGIGWLGHLFQERYGVRLNPLPTMPGARPAPSLWKLIAPAIRSAREVWLGPSGALWKRSGANSHSSAPSGTREGTPPCHACLVLTIEETQRLQQNAARRRVSLNALALWAMNRALAPDLVPGSGPAIWSVPVNMRGCVALRDPHANHLSGVEVSTAPEAWPTQIYERLLGEFRHDSHWVAWHTLTAGKWIGSLGPIVFDWIALRDSRRLTGSFSFLGEWPPPGVELKRPDFAWACSSISRAERPLGVGMILWRGRLTIGLLAHPTVSRDPGDAQRWLESWKRHMLEREPAELAA